MKFAGRMNSFILKGNSDIYTTIEMSVSYSDHGRITAPLSDMGFIIECTDYNTDITISGRIIKSRLEELQQLLTEKTCGRIKMEIIGEEFGF